MKKILFLASFGCLSWASAFAQQDTLLNRTVVVENEYNPTVMDASKINVLPKMEEPKATKKNIDYATSLRPVSTWDFQAMSPVVRQWDADKAYRGYLHGGYGNNGNVDLGVGYLWDISKNDRLNVAASLDGWNYEAKDTDGEDWKSRFYRTTVGLDYKHAFKQMDFLLGGNYCSQVFTYMSSVPYDGGVKVPGVYPQRQTMVNGYLGFVSTDKELPMQFEAEAGVNYFKMNHEVADWQTGNETNVYLKGNVWKKMGEESKVGLKARFDHYAYSFDQPDMDNASAVDLNPYYALENDRWRVRIGANIDWWGGDDDKVYVSPDVQAEYVFAGNYVAYAQAVGGRQTNSLYYLSSQVSPYWMVDRLVSTYTTLDAAIGLKASPANGWWFNLMGGYRICEDDWSPYLDYDGRSAFTSFAWGKSNVFYGRAELEYNYKDLWNMYLKGTYYNWDWKDETEVVSYLYPDGGLKPELEISAGVGAKVLEGLRVNLGYDYVKRANDEYDPISNLHVEGTYALLKNLQVYAKVNNLLNKDYVRPDAYPAQGFNLLAGLSFRF